MEGKRKDIQLITITSASVRPTRRKAIKRKKKRRFNLRGGICLAACAILLLLGAQKLTAWMAVSGSLGGYPTELTELLERNPETKEFVRGYEQRGQYQEKEIDLAGDFVPEQVPLLLQWDKRWGYQMYGNKMIALTGCGPVCLTMGYLYLTQDTTMNPVKMAEYASANGYCKTEGTSWDLWTTGVNGLGLKGNEIPLDENRMKNSLDNNAIIICSMAPGDFTTSGHFILLRGYDENGFYVNDPNSRGNSDKQWSYETLQKQIKCLWEITA